MGAGPLCRKYGSIRALDAVSPLNVLCKIALNLRLSQSLLSDLRVCTSSLGCFYIAISQIPEVSAPFYCMFIRRLGSFFALHFTQQV